MSSALMASYWGPVMAAACCTYCTSAWNSLARSSFSRSMSWSRVTLRAARRSRSAAVSVFAGLALAALAVFFGAGLATGSPLLMRVRRPLRPRERPPPKGTAGQRRRDLWSRRRCAVSSPAPAPRRRAEVLLVRLVGALRAQTVEREVQHRHQDQRQEGRGEQAADDHHGERRGEEPALAADAERHRDQRQDRGDGRHEDRPQPATPALDDGGAGVHALAPELLDEVEQHDGVGHHDADQHQQADEARHAEARAGDDQREDRRRPPRTGC